MALDTSTPSLQLLLQGTGNNNNTWGDNLNKFVIERLEQAIAGVTTIVVNGGSLSLSSDQARNGTIQFEGDLAAKQIIVVDNAPKFWNVANMTTGAFVLHLKTASGDPVSIPQGTVKQIYCDGEDHLIRLDESSVGDIVMNGGPTPRPGTLPCAGGTYNREDHPELFRRIGTTWGEGNGATTAGLPNLTDTNRFPRAAGGDLAVGDYQSSQNKSHDHTASASTSVSASGTTSTAGNHFHANSLNDPGHTHSATSGYVGDSVQQKPLGSGAAVPVTTHWLYINSAKTGITISNANAGNHSHTLNVSASASTTVTVNSDGGDEARPEAAAVLMCIVI